MSQAPQEGSDAVGNGAFRDDDINGLAVVADIQGDTRHEIQDMPSPHVQKMRTEGKEPSFFAMHPAGDDVDENAAVLSSPYRSGKGLADHGQKSAMKSGSRRMDLSVQVAEPEDGEAAPNAYGKASSRSRRNAEEEVDRLLQGLPIGTVLTVNRIVIKAQAHIRGVMARKAQTAEWMRRRTQWPDEHEVATFVDQTQITQASCKGARIHLSDGKVSISHVSRSRIRNAGGAKCGRVGEKSATRPSQVAPAEGSRSIAAQATIHDELVAKSQTCAGVFEFCAGG